MTRGLEEYQTSQKRWGFCRDTVLPEDRRTNARPDRATKLVRHSVSWETEVAKVVCCCTKTPSTGIQGLPARRNPPDRELSWGPDRSLARCHRFHSGHLLGSVSGELGLRPYLEGLGHTFVVTSDKMALDPLSSAS